MWLIIIGEKPPIAPETTSLPSFRVHCSYLFESIKINYTDLLFYKIIHKAP